MVFDCVSKSKPDKLVISFWPFQNTSAYCIFYNKECFCLKILCIEYPVWDICIEPT